ncbi:hypothetical protein OG204_34665 [Streptomyces sp. NBC_01387]|uniref:hypothetical protein n=1 Tax=unclassified Streptomyces TaxID=2593676 RepID=UPI00225BC990|nr:MULTISPECIES: hypothetical protein [unclassified Streptomyces]MCX4553255.1 hypothetical protein [Streptomyces sp. NBC_01500]WSC18228.1 hypothetical protein OIE60_00425 [Streptomyces sp. NBC_01766]
MKKSAAVACLAAVAVVSLTGCSSEDTTGDAEPAASSSAPAADDGIPPKPTGADRDACLKATGAVDPALVTDEETVIDAGRNRCSSLSGGRKSPDECAAARFGTDAHPVTIAQGKKLNAVLRKTLCPA